MSWFRRKSKDEDSSTQAESTAAGRGGDGEATPGDDADAATTKAGERKADDRGTGDGGTGDGGTGDGGTGEADDRETRRRELGPLDVSEAERDERRIDLGALQLPGRQEMELRLEVEDSSQRVIAVTVAIGGSSLQLQAFAAPRSLGVWDDVRTEIAAQVTRQGGTADEVPGPFGRELIARVPVRTPDGRTGHSPNRFVGVDGPRWFLRGVFAGPAAHDATAAAPLEEVLRSAVVVRGSEAMAPRDLLPLKLPAGARPTPRDDAGPAEESGSLAPPKRGPEMTETR